MSEETFTVTLTAADRARLILALGFMAGGQTIRGEVCDFDRTWDANAKLAEKLGASHPPKPKRK